MDVINTAEIKDSVLTGYIIAPANSDPRRDFALPCLGRYKLTRGQIDNTGPQGSNVSLAVNDGSGSRILGFNRPLQCNAVTKFSGLHAHPLGFPLR